MKLDFTFEPTSRIYRDACKLAVSMFAVTLVGCLVPQHIADPTLSQNLLHGFEWAAITTVMVSSSVTGNSAARGFERCIGTIMGGWLAFGLESASHNGIYLGFMALIVGWVGFTVGYAADLKYGIGKLFSQAFIVVLFGGRYSGAQLFSTAVSRISGIIGGMIVYLLVSLIVFPSTGTDLALRQLAAAMGHLKAMHEAIWHSAFLVMLQEPSHHDSRKGLTGVQKLSGIRKMSIQSSKADEDDLSRPLVAVVLEHLDALVLALRKFDDNMAFAKSERYVTTLKRPVYMRLYLPVLKWLNKDAKGLPVEQLQAVRRSIRHASRCLWTLSLAVGDVPQPPMVRRMRSRHGAAVFEELGLSQAAAMQDIASSFKLDEAIEEYCSSDNVLRMLEALEVLLSKNAQHWQGLPLWSEEQPANGDTGGPNFALLQSDASHDLDDKQPSGSIAVDLNGRYPSQAEVRRRSNEAAGPARSAAADDKGLHRPLMPLSNYDKGDEGFFMKMRFNTFLFSQ
ncbi:hypothetical protein WJX73_002173 [Symbiochloris irregularis]|uniref:Uncharacterized protein n=1 Tax=Symbiochloris irregularis TaxID=706552 RepID=A0AAW1PWE0_9CHLO